MTSFDNVPGGFAINGPVDYANAGSIMAEGAARIDEMRDEIVLDIGGKSEGVISIDEFSDADAIKVRVEGGGAIVMGTAAARRIFVEE